MLNRVGLVFGRRLVPVVVLRRLLVRRMNKSEALAGMNCWVLALRHVFYVTDSWLVRFVMSHRWAVSSSQYVFEVRLATGEPAAEVTAKLIVVTISTHRRIKTHA